MNYDQLQAQDVVYALASSPNFARDGVCFAARASGLYRSDDGGRSWAFQYETLEPNLRLSTTAIAVSPNFERDSTVFAGVKGGILRSGDGGWRWDVAILPDPPPLISTLVVSPFFVDDGTILAGSVDDGVFCSMDRGVHWTAWNFGLLDLHVLCMALSPDFGSDETVFVGTETGLFRSTNGGRAWRESGLPTEFAPVLDVALSPDYAEDATIFVGTEAAGLLRSTDEGRNWTRLGQDILADTANKIILSRDSSGRLCLLVMQEEALHMSVDGGISWTNRLQRDVLPDGLTALSAPWGINGDSPLLVGLMSGHILHG